MRNRYCPSDVSRSELRAELEADAFNDAVSEATSELQDQLDQMVSDYDELVDLLKSVTTELDSLYRKIDDIDPADTSPKEVAQEVHAIGDDLTALLERICNVLDEVAA